MMKNPAPLPLDPYLVRSDESCLKTTGKFIGYGTIVGTTVAVASAQNPLVNIHYMEILGTSFARFVFPAALVGGMFASTTCLMDDMRGRDKPTSNGFIGGAMAGLVLGSKGHSPSKALYYAGVLGLVGAAARFAATGGLLIYNPEVKLRESSKTLYLSDIRHLDPTNSK
jgi:hypothetical protein